MALLLIGILCASGIVAQNKYPDLNLSKSKNKPKPIATLAKPSVSSVQTKGFLLPNGNIVMSEGLGKMPCILPDMSEYPNYTGLQSYHYKGLAKIPNVSEL